MTGLPHQGGDVDARDAFGTRQLKGEGIPLLCRILLVVDGYDAMATARSYHRARSHAEVMQIMESEQGTKLDPAVLAEFTRLVGQRGQQASL